MPRRPAAIAFDVIETLFSLESLRPRLGAAGLPPHALETWFAATLRDAFALDAAGTPSAFRDVAKGTLAATAAQHGAAPDEAALDAVLDGFAELDPHPDVAPAFALLAEAGIPAIALTNGSEAVTRRLFNRAGLGDAASGFVSVESVGRWKPNAEVYRACAEAAGCSPRDLALVAAHGWDVHGAAQAGLITGFVRRNGEPDHPAMRAADVSGPDLPSVVEALLGA